MKGLHDSGATGRDYWFLLTFLAGALFPDAARAEYYLQILSCDLPPSDRLVVYRRFAAQVGLPPAQQISYVAYFYQSTGQLYARILGLRVNSENPLTRVTGKDFSLLLVGPLQNGGGTYQLDAVVGGSSLSEAVHCQSAPEGLVGTRQNPTSFQAASSRIVPLRMRAARFPSRETRL